MHPVDLIEGAIYRLDGELCRAEKTHSWKLALLTPGGLDMMLTALPGMVFGYGVIDRLGTSIVVGEFVRAAAFGLDLGAIRLFPWPQLVAESWADYQEQQALGELLADVEVSL